MITFDQIKPIVIYLSDDDKWKDRTERAEKHFEENGIDNILWVNGVHGEAFGVGATRPYQRDVPDTDWKLEPRTVGCYLSAYMVFNIALSHPEWKYIMYLEDDTRFHEGWKYRAHNALANVPQDFDWLFLSHCCTEGKAAENISGEVYELKYPQAGHVSIIATKCIPKIIKECRNACIPFDIHLHDGVFNELKVYTMLPRLAEQENTFLPA